jgi:diguanylate cyclase (GGDEF)-like protein
MAGFLAEEKLIIARTDRLTGLWNRTAIVEKLDLAVRAAKQSALRMAVVIIDVDLMAQFNDRHGHDAGDELLRLAGNRLSATLGSRQELGRMGADRFLAILPELESSNEALQTARELLRGIRKPFRILRREVSISASAGVSVLPHDAGDMNGLLRSAESAMVSAKSRGRDAVERYSSGRRAPRSRRYAIEVGLQGALENAEFELLYQPQTKIDGSLQGFEILLAWDHPVFGTITAGEFIPAAEESGLIVPIGAWVLREACERLALWERAGHGRMNIAVNVSTLQFDRPDFVELVAQTLLIHGVDPGQLELELTESAVMSNVTQSVKIMRQLRRIGVRLAIDDFGTGYSSLSYLTRLPVHTLKIDRSFLHDVDPPESALPTIRAIVALAHDLGMKVVGEGVEKFSQLKMLEGVDCDYIQGHLFGRPLPLDAATRLLEGRQGLVPPAGRD